MVFLHFIHGEHGRAELPELPAKITSATLLDGGKVEVRSQNGKLLVTLPDGSRGANDTIVKLELDRSAMDIPALE